MANILFVRSNIKNTKCTFGRNGNFIIESQWSVNGRGDMDIMMNDMDKFLNDYFAVSYAQKAEDGYFFRFTSDKDEFRKIQDGEYTRSVNHQDNRLERGISVSDNMSYLALGAYDYFYIVSGKVIGRGSDGEPLLEPATMEKHSPYKSISCYCKKAQKKEAEKKEKFLQEYGWTAEQLRDLEYESIRHKCKKQYINPSGEIEDYSPWGNCPQKIFEEGEFKKWQNEAQTAG